jgi:hypothetical protein
MRKRLVQIESKIAQLRSKIAGSSMVSENISQTTGSGL